MTGIDAIMILVERTELSPLVHILNMIFWIIEGCYLSTTEFIVVTANTFIPTSFRALNLSLYFFCINSLYSKMMLFFRGRPFCVIHNFLT